PREAAAHARSWYTRAGRCRDRATPPRPPAMPGAEGHTRCRRPVECLEPPVTALPLEGWAPPEGSAPAPQASTVPPVALALPSEGSALPPERGAPFPPGV